MRQPIAINGITPESVTCQAVWREYRMQLIASVMGDEELSIKEIVERCKTVPGFAAADLPRFIMSMKVAGRLEKRINTVRDGPHGRCKHLYRVSHG